MPISKVNFEYSDDVTVINEEQFNVHMRLYEGYVNKFNEINEILWTNPDTEGANSTYSKFRGLKRGETFSLNGVILHEYYFENIGSTNKEPDNFVSNVIEHEYQSLDKWKEHFLATAKSSRGWVIWCYEPRTGAFRIDSLDAHDVGNFSLSIPLLVLDMYEHAYFLQYADNKIEYMNNFMNNIDWNVVRNRIMQI